MTEVRSRHPDKMWQPAYKASMQKGKTGDPWTNQASYTSKEDPHSELAPALHTCIFPQLYGPTRVNTHATYIYMQKSGEVEMDVKELREKQ